MNFMQLKQELNCALRLCSPTEIIFDDIVEGTHIVIKECLECERIVKCHTVESQMPLESFL